MLVLLKLTLPPAFSLPTGIGYWLGGYLPAQTSIPKQVSNMASPERTVAFPPENSPITAEVPEIQSFQVNPEPITSAIPVISDSQALTWQAVVFVIWSIGAAILSLLLIRRLLFVRRLITQSEPAKNSYINILDQCRQQLGIKRRTELRLSGKSQSPAVCGFFRPVILIPNGLLEKLSPDKLRAVLIHELAHIKRGDLWVNCIQTFLQIIYFYNPLVWLANAIIRRTREQAVDEMVLVALGYGAESYSNTLIDIAELTFFKTRMSLRLIGVVESKKALEGRINHMLNRPIPKSIKLGVIGLIALLIFGAVVLPMAKAQRQSNDNTSIALDSDKDGLENEFEAKLGTNSKSPDTDGDSLSDYDEYCKYRTDPTKKDSDGDGKPDGDWQERREYTYSIRAICEIRPPSNLEMINDLYQDARHVQKKAALDDARVVEVLIFPFATAHVYAQPFPKENLDKKLQKYIQPTASMNFSPETKKKIGDIVQGATTDTEAIEKLLYWMNSQTSLIREMPHWEYLNVIDGKIVWHRSLGSSEQDKQFLETNFLGDSMFKNKVHGTCSSMAILRGTMFRAAGLPTRLIQTLPLMTRYSEDPQPLADQLRMRAMAKGYDWGPGNGGANHTYNEVFLNNRWVRVDQSIGTSPFVGDKLFAKAWSAPSWNNLKEEWNDKRCFRALQVSDAYPKYKSALAKADIVIENKDLTVSKLPDGRYRAHLSIHNYGKTATAQFRVIFYIGDPDNKGRQVYSGYHNAGPIMPGSTWNEGTLPFDLNEDDTEIFVIVDPDNVIDESDETNNKASTVVPGREPKESTEAETSSKQNTQKEKVKVATKSSVIDISPAHFDIRLDENRGTCDLVVDIQNRSNNTIPRFKLRFYRGDPGNNLDESGNVQAGWHGAGPIEPGKSWGERTGSFHLPDGQYEFNIVLDFDNSIPEIDENNNRAELKVKIENGQIANKSVTCPATQKDSKTNVQNKIKEVSAESKIPPEMVGTWFFDNPHGNEEQMAVFQDGRVVVLYSNGHKDQTNIVDGFIELAEYNNAKCRMAVREDGTLVQYFGQKESSGKQWRRISPEPHTNLLGALTDSWGYRGKYLAKLSYDVTVELVGVCDWPKEGKRCWRPDGSQLPMEIYATNQSPEAGQYGFIYKVTGPDDIKVSCRINGASHTEGSCKVVDGLGNQLKYLTASISDMEKGRLSTTIRVGVAAGPWETIASHDGRRMTIGRQGDVLWSQAFQSNSGTHIIASREWQRDQNGRIIAIDKDGKTHTTRNGGSVSSGNILQRTSNFSNLKLEQIKEFQYQIRTFQWVEFKNISLKPGHKTDVEFVK